ncbi:Tic22 family protein [Lusitaniella coriacea]|nr:Tic22 family protein [Lusitaniella coriacea]
MMKSFFRWSATLGLVGSTLLGTLLGGNLSALALSPEEIVEQLKAVPVFTIADEEGSPLVASSSEGSDAIAGAFISQRDAIAFVEKLKQENPELGNRVQVVPVSMGEIYQLNQETTSATDGLNFAYVPTQQEVTQALTLLQAQNPDLENFPGVPLFFARGAEQDGLLTIQVEGKQLVPFFFEREHLLQQVGDTQVKVEVIPLEGLIKAFEEGQNDEFFKNVMLVPSRESLQFLRSLNQEQ